MKGFAGRHIGPREKDVKEMLNSIGAESIDALVDRTVPENIRLSGPMKIAAAVSEAEQLEHMQYLAALNEDRTSYIGLGYYNTIIPPVIQRNILENPGWYTAYTPYQAEISQGRLEALLNFQTMVSDLTGMELANASLLDEGTAAAEAMHMFYHARSREAVKSGVNKFFVSEKCFPQTIDVIKTRSMPLDIELVIGDHNSVQMDSSFFGALLQYPDTNGRIEDYKSFVDSAHEAGVKVAVASDLLSLVKLTPPGEWGADVVVGNSQRFGVPMGYGGPHAAFFATHEEFKRFIPGRIIGVSQDSHGKQAYRMALQTREQHIRRDKATSNICTAQALLAVMAGAYAVYHGPHGLKTIADQVHTSALKVRQGAMALGHKELNGSFFDTIHLEPGSELSAIRERAEAESIDLRYNEDGTICISVDETTSSSDIDALLAVLGAEETEISLNGVDHGNSGIVGFERGSEFLTHEVFHLHCSETQMMRYLKWLENKDFSLVHGMIPLGSCTMKLNAASQLMPITWAEFANVHPFTAVENTQGYQRVFEELGDALCQATGHDDISLQPNSGAQGEYAGLMVIRAYHLDRGDTNRNVVLIPSSAHGTNPASAVMAGMKVVVVKCDDQGNIDVNDLREKAEANKDILSALMVTYPSTHGVFESSIKEITSIIHENGGQVYMDGANLNAQLGLTSPGEVGADVCHLNLHKTFAIPHGGGGPGMGPITVKEHLAPFLPSNPNITTGGDKAISAISAAPWGSSLILLISYAYIRMLGAEGLTNSTKYSILNANYLRSKLSEHYDILYKGENGNVAHEMILDCREFKKSAGVEVEDIAKRLIDFGFHAPTVSFPVAGTLMVEPTESESKEELDRFIEAMITIRREIREIETGEADPANNVLKLAPHTAELVSGDNWDRPYSREKAAYPVNGLRTVKYWAPVGRVDNAYGDRNLICTCPPMEAYEEEVVA